MSITVLTDVILPESVIRAGVSGRNMRNNLRSMTLNGYANINVNWTKTLRQYEIGIAPMDLSTWHTIEGLHEVTEGGAYGFLMQDPKDKSVTSSDGLLYPYDSALVGSAGYGYGIPTYQLSKQYVAIGGTSAKIRSITRPIAAGLTVLMNSVAIAPSVDYATGIVTLAAISSQSIISHTVGASHAFNFADGTGIVAAISLGQEIYITGVTGTAASVLNNKRHIVTNKGASSITVSTSTTALTASGGSASKYAQSTDTLRWAGEFYVPVHFLDDSIEWELLRPGTDRLVSGVSIVLQEVRE